MKLAFLVLLCALQAVAQNCDQLVSDDANALNGRSAEVQAAAQELVQRGADVRIRTLSSSNLDLAENGFEHACSSWQGADGKRKSTLIALLVAPREHKMGIFYGSAWHRALDNHWNRIKQEYMGPRFHDGDFAGGFIAAAHQFAARIAASEEETLHPAAPAQNTTINQPTDYSGLWTSLKWLLGLAFFGGLILFAYIVSKRRREQRQETEEAQQAALMARNAAVAVFNRYRGMKLSPEQEAFDRIGQDFANFAGTERGNPNTDGLSAAQYNAMAAEYRRLRFEMQRAADEAPPHATPVAEPRTSAFFQNAPPPTASTTPAPAVHTTVVEQSSSPQSFEMGLIVGESLADRRREPEPEPEHHHHHHSSSDDSSSSSSSFGGSSDYGSSSDSGGGGSSDFGSSFGGDSGGGGSSDF